MIAAGQLCLDVEGIERYQIDLEVWECLREEKKVNSRVQCFGLGSP